MLLLVKVFVACRLVVFENLQLGKHHIQLMGIFNISVLMLEKKSPLKKMF